MDRQAFTQFVAKTLNELIAQTEEVLKANLPRRVAFQWLGKGEPLVTENVVEHLVQRVYIDAEHIYPCVDIGGADILKDGWLLIVGNVAGYPPCPFRRNWTGRDGPFVYIVGNQLLARISGETSNWSPDIGSFGYSTLKYVPS